MSKTRRAYSDDEIVTIYNNAESKEDEIEILAQLNACDTDTILEILIDAGAYEGTYKTCIKCGKQFLGTYRRGKSNSCPECRSNTAIITRKKTKLVKNLKKIQELSQENVDILAYLEKEKQYEGQSKVQKMQV